MEKLAFKRFVTIGVMILLTLLLHEVIVRYWVSIKRVPQSHIAAFDLKMALATEPTPPNTKRLFLLGDSKMWHGIYPELLQARLKKSTQAVMVTNHGTNGATPEMNHLLLAYALAHGVKPDLVVYNVSPMLLNRTYYRSWKATPRPAFNASFMGQCIAPKLLNNPRTLWQKVMCPLARVSQMVRHRAALADELKALVTGTLIIKQMPLTWRTGAPQVEGSMSGWAPDTELPAHLDVPAFIQAVKTSESLTPFVQDVHELQSWVAYCQQQQIPLVLIWLPEHPTMKHVYQTLNVPKLGMLEQTFTSLAKQTRADAPIWFVNLRDSDAHAEHYYNPDHQNVLGAIITTDHLAQFLTHAVWPKIVNDNVIAKVRTQSQ